MKGGDRLLRLLQAAPKAASDGVRAVIRREAEAIADAARAAAPTPPGKSGESTGALKAAIRVRYSQRGLVARVGIFGPPRKKREALAGIAAGLKAKRGISLRQARRVAAQLGGDVFYAHFVEFGTVKMKAQPFLYPPFRAKRRAIRAEIAQAAVKAIKKAAR